MECTPTVDYIKQQNDLIDLAEAKGLITPLVDWQDNKALFDMSLFFIQRWLYEIHGIHVIPHPKILYPDNAVSEEYYVSIYDSTGEILDNDDMYWGYYEAV